MILVQHKQWGKGSVYREQLAGPEGEQRACRILLDQSPTYRLVCEGKIDFTLWEIYVVYANHLT
jgi:hypothetical protein